jgi:predicted nucleic acid-binding protein
MSNLLIDTDVLIDVSRSIPEAVNCLQIIEPHITLAISTITQMELLVGCCNNREQRQLERFLMRFEVLAFNERISERAVGLLQQYRLSHNLLIPDALIAATSLFWNIPFVTKNQRDYRFIDGLLLLPYPCSLVDIGIDATQPESSAHEQETPSTEE